MAVSAMKITTRLNTNDKKAAAADPTDGNKKSKKDKKKKKKKAPSSHEAASKNVKSYEQVTERSFDMAPDDWQEGYNDEYSFDDISTMVNRACSDEYTVKAPSGPYPATNYSSCRYYVYKIWPDKVVCKRSYDNRNSDDPLFMMHPYDIENDEAVLGDGIPVEMGFVPAVSQPRDFMVAMREADEISVEDPELAKHIAEGEEPDEEEDEDIEADEDQEEDDEAGSDDPDDSEGESEEDEEDVEESAELREDVANLQEQEFTENFDAVVDDKCNIIEEVDKKTGKIKGYILENMAMLGGKSKNGRTYSKEVRLKSAKIFEGCKAYCNHPKKGEEDNPRMVEELIGRHKGVYFDEATDMLRSNLHLSPTTTVKDYIIPHARANPGIIGNSINASGKIASDGNVMEITRSRSVDIVSDPATTNGLFEAVDPKAQKINNKEGGSSVMENDEGMTIEELVEQIKAGTADKAVIEALREHFVEESEVVGSVENMQEQIDDLSAQLAEYKVKETAENARAEVTKLLKESKLPTESKTDDGLIEVLMKTEAADRPALIARMEKIAESAGSKDGPAPSHQREKEVVTEGDGSNVDRVKLSKSLVEAFTAPNHRNRL